jgi:acyl-CoA dehydrogenase
MDFELTERCKDLQERLHAFMDERVYPAEPVYEEQMRASGRPNFHPPILEELKEAARSRGLWNLFHPNPDEGPGLTNAEYAPLAEITGRSLHVAPEAMNCSAPDTGNMEVLSRFGSEEHKRRWLRPLLDGEIRSAFAMTEPDVASSDATNIATRIERDGDEYVINGRKWWISNALHANCRVLIVVGKTDPDAPRHRQHSMLIVPIDTPGVEIVRALPIFGYQDRKGHAEIVFRNVRVHTDALLAGEGDGFMIGQSRLGLGRVHHCMRLIGMAERALDLLCQRALSRTTFGRPLAENANVMDWIAESRIALEMTRLLTMKAAWLMDTVGTRRARVAIAAIKVAAPATALSVLDRAIQVHGGGGVSDDQPLANFWAQARTLRLADGPDEVHKRTLAQHELRHWEGRTGAEPAGHAPRPWRADDGR